MKKRIIISESEKKNILSQHKQTIKNESELRKKSLSEREMSKLINNILINEASGNPCDTMYCEPGTTCVNGKCVSNAIGAKSTKTAMKEAGGKGSCTSDSQCPRGQRCVGGSCSITTALKESAPCKSESDCPPNMACYNGKCSVTTSAKEMKEGKACPPGQQQCGGGCCPKGSSCRLGMCQSGISQPTAPIFNESELDEAVISTNTTSKVGDCPGNRCAGGCCRDGEMCNPQTGLCYIKATPTTK